MKRTGMLKTETVTNVISSSSNSVKIEQLKWREKSKSELVATSRVNMMKRLSKIMDKANEYDPLFKHFEIKKDDIRRMFSDVDNAINSWRGVDITSCKKQKNSFKAYKVTATNWFNRNKAKIYGNYFFCPLIFKHLLGHCRDLKGAMTDAKRMELFIALFLQIFGGKITFARTKAQPLMPYQTLIQPNKFRNKCKELVHFYDLEWNQNAISPSKVHRIYQKDKCRSHKIFDSFIKCLKAIQNKLSSPQESQKYGFFRLQAQSVVVEKENQNQMSNDIVMQNQNIIPLDAALVNNGLSPNINQMINNIASIPIQLPLPVQMNNIHMMPSFNPIPIVNHNHNNQNGIRIRYQLLSIHPHLPPIVISQNVV
eukprot:90188_1